MRGLRLRPEFEPLEWREVPNDPLGLLQAPLLGSGLALLGASLKTPAGVLAHGWNDAALPVVDPATVPSRLADSPLSLPPSDTTPSHRPANSPPASAAPTPATQRQAPPPEDRSASRREADWGLDRSTDDWLAEVGLALNAARRRLAADAADTGTSPRATSPGGAATGGGSSAHSAPASPANADPLLATTAAPDEVTLAAGRGATTGSPRAAQTPRPAVGPTASPLLAGGTAQAIPGPVPTATPGAPQDTAPASPVVPQPTHPQALDPEFGKPRLIFESNQGQATAEAAFVARARDHACC